MGIPHTVPARQPSSPPASEGAELPPPPPARALDLQAQAELRDAAARVLAILGDGGILTGMNAPQRRYTVSARSPKGRDGRNYQLVIRTPEGKVRQRSAKTTDPDEAERRAREEEARLNGCDPRTPDPTLGEIMRQYVESRRHDAKPRTIESLWTSQRRMESLMGDRAVSKATVLRVRDRLLADGLTAATANRYLRHAARAWEWARERELVTEDWPRLRPLKARRTRKRPASPDEIDAVLEELATTPRYLPAALLLADSGAREGEVCALRERDVDREANLVTFWETKTEARTIHVTPEVLAAVPRADSPDAYLFPSSGPLGHMSIRVLGRAFREAKRRAGLGDRPFDVHSLRRSWIMVSLREGNPLSQSMRHVGHRSPATHLYYQRLAASEGMEEVAARVARARPIRIPRPERV